MWDYDQSGRRGTRVLKLRSYLLIKDAHDAYLEKRAPQMTDKEWEEVQHKRDFFEKILERIPRFRASLRSGDFNHPVLEGHGPAIINFIIQTVSLSY